MKIDTMPSDSLKIAGASTIFCILISFVTSNQISVDEHLPDISPNDPAFESFVEEHRKSWIAPDDVRQPKVNVTVELGKLNFSHISQNWPASNRKLGSVSAISFDSYGNIVVFHRGNHVWDTESFNRMNEYTKRNRGPITDNTIIAFNSTIGHVSYEWGNNLFYMPHGLTIDYENNVWVTDVALHQVFKFNPINRTTPELTLGVAFTPGNSFSKFCKPTAVAVLKSGDFFVADGYCNSRIIKYSRKGEIILRWGKITFAGIPFNHAPPNFFAIPHALTLADDLGLLCVADRENGRVQCFNVMNGTFHSQYHSGIVGDRLFSVAYAPINGGQLYVINGPEKHRQVMGFVINMQSKLVISRFGPKQSLFRNPHDIIVSPDGNEIYVVELSPNLVHKLIAIDSSVNDAAENIPKEPFVNSIKTRPFKQTESVTASGLQSSRQLLFILGLFVSFICITLLAVWIIARRRKLDSRNRRRHAWDFPTVKTDGYKLGNLLERKQNFVKLDQEASDDEMSSNKNALNTRFA